MRFDRQQAHDEGFCLRTEVVGKMLDCLHFFALSARAREKQASAPSRTRRRHPLAGERACELPTALTSAERATVRAEATRETLTLSVA